jgi:hypothetical protein
MDIENFFESVEIPALTTTTAVNILQTSAMDAQALNDAPPIWTSGKNHIDQPSNELRIGPSATSPMQK